ncbi:MAG: 1-deoxy-D-xylulose-5-phosphate reductoisomerase [Coriobacteriia bacterium]|nr:1-deoxy-D-xylulose-5-phosphate reductoisomerase [Coriobacteriia bacterium]
MKVLVLGATGSIGKQTLDVINQHPDKLEISGLVSYSSDIEGHEVLHTKDNPDAQKQINEMINNTDIVVNAMSGAIGLESSFTTLKAGKRLALANKESLVVGGDLLMPMDRGNLTPIDSEHGAIFQCLIGEDHAEVKQLWITASGGPFRGRKNLDGITKEDALAHPTWNMGPKITIDSATLMNKGLEVIEAHHLFNMPYEKIKVVVQPQSAIHSMVEFIDGSVKAHLGTTDMRIPIQYALSHPLRWKEPVEPMDFTKLGSIDFEEPDMETFKCLKLAYKAGSIGGTMPCIMNAANEVAVSAFLSNKIEFKNIQEIVEKAMENFESEDVESIEQLKYKDKDVREYLKNICIFK